MQRTNVGDLMSMMGEPIKFPSKQNNIIRPQDMLSYEPEEEEPKVWEPEETTIDTLKSLHYFQHFSVDGQQSNKKEIRESFANFDDWLLGSISDIVQAEKDKEDKMFE